MHRSLGRQLFSRWFFGVGKVVAAALALVLPLAGCLVTGTVQLPFLPVELAISSDGSITLSASSQIVTPLGTFRLQVSGAKNIHAPSDGTLLVIRHPVRGVAMDSFYGIHLPDKLRFVLDGDSSITTNRNVVTLNLRNNVHGIRIQNVQQAKSAPKYATQQVRVLPPAPKAA
ncbi:hypothetical protein, partial [Frankia sp. CiP3]|uniref:hypothetical protein n=1 Tax=Frankia sp. CiP3 TaxID=2880971 RepID=UPI001EF6FE00